MKYKRDIIILMLFVLFVPLLSSCFKIDMEEYESGYFKYSIVTRYVTLFKKEEPKAYITGLTEVGLKQEYLVYPEKLDGCDIYGFGYEKRLPQGCDYIGYIDCTNIKKLFFPTIQRENLYRQEIIRLSDGAAIYWCENFDLTHSFAGDSIYAAKQVVGYNLFKTNEDMLKKIFNDFYIANVSYLYNYYDAPNDNYYWVDTYNEENIQFIPPDPVRDGYLFCGWYKDVECTKKWDFTENITPKEILIKQYDSQYNNYSGIYLYAKWIKG